MTNQATTITSAEMKRRKATLEAKLREPAGISRDREELQVEVMADPGDQTRWNADREVVIQRLNHQTGIIQDIQSALTKLEEGAYGLCEQCESEIPQRRLEVAPWARLCVPCQSQQEATAQDGNPVFEHAA